MFCSVQFSNTVIYRWTLNWLSIIYGSSAVYSLLHARVHQLKIRLIFNWDWWTVTSLTDNYEIIDSTKFNNSLHFSIPSVFCVTFALPVDFIRNNNYLYKIMYLFPSSPFKQVYSNSCTSYCWFGAQLGNKVTKIGNNNYCVILYTSG